MGRTSALYDAKEANRIVCALEEQKRIIREAALIENAAEHVERRILELREQIAALGHKPCA